VTIDSVDIINMHLTIAVSHNALQIRNYLQDNPHAKMDTIEPVLKPSLLLITPSVSDAESFDSLREALVQKFKENGDNLDSITGDGLPVQHKTLLKPILGAKNSPMYNLCLAHTEALSVNHTRQRNRKFQVVICVVKKITKICNKNHFRLFSDVRCTEYSNGGGLAQQTILSTYCVYDLFYQFYWR
jgi:hypothetical protein